MPKKKPIDPNKQVEKCRPALTPEAREQQLIALATDLAEEQLRNGTASAQVITHYLKLGTTKADLEKKKLELENGLTEAKTKSIMSAESQEKLYKEAIDAFKIYSGTLHREEYDDEYNSNVY